jgi:hypothetical protein
LLYLILILYGNSITLYPGALPGNTDAQRPGSSLSTTEITSTSVEQEKYFQAIVNATPFGNCHMTPVFIRDSLTSLDSCFLSSYLGDSPILGEGGVYSESSKSRHRGFLRAVSGLRGSGGKSKCKRDGYIDIVLSHLVLIIHKFIVFTMLMV